MWQGIDEVDVLDEQKLDSDLGRARNANMLHVNPGAGELHPDFERGDGKATYDSELCDAINESFPFWTPIVETEIQAAMDNGSTENEARERAMLYENILCDELITIRFRTVWPQLVGLRFNIHNTNGASRDQFAEEVRRFRDRIRQLGYWFKILASKPGSSNELEFHLIKNDGLVPSVYLESADWNH